MTNRIAYMLDINGRRRIADVEGTTPLLRVMTEEPGLSCMPFACSAGLCGACTIEVDGVAVRACTFPVEEALGRKIVSPGGGATSSADKDARDRGDRTPSPFS